MQPGPLHDDVIRQEGVGSAQPGHALVVPARQAAGRFDYVCSGFSIAHFQCVLHGADHLSLSCGPVGGSPMQSSVSVEVVQFEVILEEVPQQRMQVIVPFAGRFTHQQAAQVLHFVQRQLAVLSFPDEIRGFRVDGIQDADVAKEPLLLFRQTAEKVVREIAAKLCPGSAKTPQQQLAVVAAAQRNLHQSQSHGPALGNSRSLLELRGVE